MKKYTFQDAIKAMENRVKRYVKHYKDDFYKYDLQALQKAETAGPPLRYSCSVSTELWEIMKVSAAMSASVSRW